MQQCQTTNRQCPVSHLLTTDTLRIEEAIRTARVQAWDLPCRQFSTWRPQQYADINDLWSMSKREAHGRIVNATPIAYGSSTEALLDVIDRGGEPRAAAFAALCDKGDPEALRTILEYSESNDWRLRRLAAEHLGHWGSNSSALSALRELAAGDESEFVVRSALDQLGQFGDLESQSLVLSLALDSSEETQLVALRALERLGSSAHFEPIFALFGDTQTDRARKQTGWLLRAIADSETWPVLFSAFESDPLHRHRVWACDLAAEFGTPADLRLLALLLEDRDGHVRKAAKAAQLEITSRRQAPD